MAPPKKVCVQCQEKTEGKLECGHFCCEECATVLKAADVARRMAMEVETAGAEGACPRCLVEAQPAQAKRRKVTVEGIKERLVHVKEVAEEALEDGLEAEGKMDEEMEKLKREYRALHEKLEREEAENLKKMREIRAEIKERRDRRGLALDVLAQQAEKMMEGLDRMGKDERVPFLRSCRCVLETAEKVVLGVKSIGVEASVSTHWGKDSDVAFAVHRMERGGDVMMGGEWDCVTVTLEDHRDYEFAMFPSMRLLVGFLDTKKVCVVKLDEEGDHEITHCRTPDGMPAPKCVVSDNERYAYMLSTKMEFGRVDVLNMSYEPLVCAPELEGSEDNSIRAFFHHGKVAFTNYHLLSMYDTKDKSWSTKTSNLKTGSVLSHPIDPQKVIVVFRDGTVRESEFEKGIQNRYVLTLSRSYMEEMYSVRTAEKEWSLLGQDDKGAIQEYKPSEKEWKVVHEGSSDLITVMKPFGLGVFFTGKIANHISLSYFLSGLLRTQSAGNFFYSRSSDEDDDDENSLDFDPFESNIDDPIIIE